MSNPKKIRSFFGEPPREFYLYPNCEYKYGGRRCIYLEPLEDTELDKNQALIKLKDFNSLHTVPLSSLSPIPLSVDLLNRYRPSVDREEKVWDFNDAKLPYKVIDTGKYFVYTNDELVGTGNAPIPIEYLSDLQIVQNSYELKRSYGS